MFIREGDPTLQVRISITGSFLFCDKKKNNSYKKQCGGGKGLFVLKFQVTIHSMGKS